MNSLNDHPACDPNDHATFTKKAIETAIRITVLGILVVWTVALIRPFLIPVVWGIILAVAVDPFIARFSKILGDRRSLAAMIFVTVVIACLVIPTILLTMSSIDTIYALTAHMHAGNLNIPPPPAAVADWPLIGPKLHQFWLLGSTNLAALLKQFAPQMKSAVGPLIGSIGGGLFGFFMVIISTCIAGVLLAKSEKSASLARKIVVRFAGHRGHQITDLTVGAIRGVMQGVVGVAIIQAILAALGMLVIGVPAAGFWALLVLICAVSQLPPLIVLGPIAAYVFTSHTTVPAVLFLIWIIFVGLCDNFLKPMLMGRGIDMPMLIILVGSLGGMMLSGIIGLFVGAVVLAIMYILFMAWLEDSDQSRAMIDN